MWRSTKRTNRVSIDGKVRVLATSRVDATKQAEGAVRPHEGAAAVKHTQRARSADPQARGPLSQWTEAWPTQPAITQAVALAGPP